ncbi:hypothetical protein D9M71_831690 [compost metagenome]
MDSQQGKDRPICAGRQAQITPTHYQAYQQYCRQGVFEQPVYPAMGLDAGGRQHGHCYRQHECSLPGGRLR